MSTTDKSVVATGFDEEQCECGYEWFEQHIPFERMEEIMRDVEVMGVRVERAVEACLPDEVRKQGLAVGESN